MTFTPLEQRIDEPCEVLGLETEGKRKARADLSALSFTTAAREGGSRFLVAESASCFVSLASDIIVSGILL